MTSSLWRFGITLAFLGFASIRPATVGAQPPVYLTQWGSAGTGDGQFSSPTGIATDPAGNVFVVDYHNYRVQKFTSTGTYLTQWGTVGSGDGQFDGLGGIATDAAGDVYVVDGFNNRIQKFTGTGTYITQWGSFGSGNGEFYYPVFVATDPAGDVYVSDAGNYRIQKFTGTGTYLTQWGTFGSGDGQFIGMAGVATDAAGNVYVGEYYNYRIQKFTGTGAYLTQWGSYGSGDGQFDGTDGVATDAAGNVYVVDVALHRIQEFTDTGTYLTQWGSFGSGNGQFHHPSAAATDASGNIYVTDTENNRVQKFGPAPPIAMAFDFKPHDLHLNSKGKWVTGYLRPPAPYPASQIDVASIRLNGVVPVSTEHPARIEEHDTRLKVKFLRADVKPTLAPGDAVPVVVTGMIAGQPFTGTDYIKVKAPKVHTPKAGDIVAAGNTVEVTWDLTDTPAPTVTLLLSLDDGVTWSIEAQGIANTGRYDWTAPAVATDQARVAVVQVYDTDETGVVSESELAESDGFSILIPAGIDGGGGAFAMSASNPVVGPLEVRFSLASGAKATLAVYDVSGRQVASREVGSGGPGWHTVQLGEFGNMPAGLYVVRLTQDGRSLTVRSAILR